MKRTIVLFAILFAVQSNAQDTIYARHIIDTLTSKTFFGRGYLNDGMKLCKAFLIEEFNRAGLKPLSGKNFSQEFSYPVNTFPGEVFLKMNGRELRPGYDFIVAPESKGISGSFTLKKADSTHFISKKDNLVVSLEEKLTWSVAPGPAGYSSVEVLKSALTEEPKKIELKLENNPIRSFRAANVCGMVKGTVYPDSFIIFTAHYDHLGGLGKEVYFPGANDNASGISLLLGLAKYYSENPQPYSIGFICFAGEEAGLVGSKYFVENPLVSLDAIRFLVNLDLMGTGVEGITVVNATEFPKEFEILKSISEKNNLLAAVNSRGKAQNSDHYWFTENGVPSFFIYALGGIKAYHDVYDIAATLPNNEYLDLFRLLKEFTGELMGHSAK